MLMLSRGYFIPLEGPNLIEESQVHPPTLSKVD